MENHESHARAYAILDRVQSGKDEGYVSAHSLAEMYAVLTRLPPPFRHTSEQALLSIEENVVKHFKIASLTGGDYTALIREAVLAGIQGGTIYDAVLLKCAAKSEAEKVFTLNLRGNGRMLRANPRNSRISNSCGSIAGRVARRGARYVA